MNRDQALALPEPYRVEDLAFSSTDGLLPAVVQHASSGGVLMVGYCDADAVRAMLASGLATFFSRSRREAWVKGETSGNTLRVLRIEVDCDADTLLLHCIPAGPTCHTGSTSCFSDSPTDYSSSFVHRLDDVVRTRAVERPEGSYTTSLFEAGVRRIAQKVGEEGVETALAAVAQDDPALLSESADLLYHLLVLLRSKGLSFDEVESVLAARHG